MVVVKIGPLAIRLVVTVLMLLVVSPLFATTSQAAPVDLVTMLQGVSGAVGQRYDAVDAVDNQGVGMDTTALLANAYNPTWGTVALNRTLSPCHEGTPNIYAATLNPDIRHSVINVGFHYHRDCQLDQEARGTLTNFSTWTAQADSNVNA